RAGCIVPSSRIDRRPEVAETRFRPFPFGRGTVPAPIAKSLCNSAARFLSRAGTASPESDKPTMPDTIYETPGNPVPQDAVAGMLAMPDGRRLRYAHFRARARPLRGTVVL